MVGDDALVGQLARGDAEALRLLLERHDRQLHAFVTRHTGGRDVDDLCQETWLRVVRAADRFDRSRRFTTWLFQIALNCCRDWHRRRPTDPVDPAAAARMLGASEDRDPAAALDAARLLATLPDAHRSVVVLRYYHDLGEEEVAQVLGCPRGTVKSRLHHAMRRLVDLVRTVPR